MQIHFMYPTFTIHTTLIVPLTTHQSTTKRQIPRHHVVPACSRTPRNTAPDKQFNGARIKRR